MELRYELRTSSIQTSQHSGKVWYIWDREKNKMSPEEYFTMEFLAKLQLGKLNRNWQKELGIYTPKKIPKNQKCNECGEDKPSSEFNIHFEFEDELYETCKDCISESFKNTGINSSDDWDIDFDLENHDYFAE